MSIQDLELQERQLAIEERKTDLENKKLQNAALKRDADKARMDDSNRNNQTKAKGQTLKSQRNENKFADVRKTCNHQMGGKGREALLSGRGSKNEQSAVIKIKLPTGDVMIRCPRCRAVTLPPWDMNFYFGPDGKWLAKEQGGKLDKEKYKAAQDKYNEWYNLSTDLAMVQLPQYRWARGGKPINREKSYCFVRGEIDSPASDFYTKEYYDSLAATKKV